MKPKTLTILAGAAMVSFASCTNDMQELDAGQPQLLKQIVMTTEDFQPEADSRTLYQIADGAVQCTWAASDTVGVFPDEGAQAYFPMKSGEGAKNASFDGKGWALKDGRTYGAYYPCIGEFYLDRHAVPVNYDGQTQTGNASMAHLGAYDYMVAAPVAPEFGSAQFMFKHLSALVQLKLTIPQPATLTSMKLVAETDAFALEGKVDIMANAPGITPVASASDVELVLKDIKTTEANQVVTLYMMLPPADLSAQTLKAVVATADKGTLEMALESKNFQAGKAYGLSGAVEDKDIVGDGTYKDGIVSLAEAGTMKKLLGKDYLSITSLKVVGPINGDDVYYLRKMLGATYFSQAERGNLETIDLSDARIVEGGGWYYEYKYNSSSTGYYYTTNDVIGYKMFYQCTNLKEIALPDGVTSIGSEAFEYCSALTTVTIGDGVVSIGNDAFDECDALTSVYIKDLSAWCRIEFSGSSSNPSSSNPLYNGAKLYLDNKEVTELVIPEDITEIKNFTFNNCESIVKVVIPDGVTSIGSCAFWGCSALTTVTIGDGVTSIGSKVFQYCYYLTSVTIGDGVTSIGEDAFEYCSALTSVYVKDLSVWCRIAFTGLTASPLCNGAKLYLDNKELTELLVIPEDITKIWSWAFYGYESIVKVVIPDNVTSIGYAAFYNCDALTTVTIGDGVTSIGSEAFYNCDALTTVTIGDGVTSIGSEAFQYCSALTSVTIGDGVTSIGDYAFYNCDALTDFYCHATTPPSIYRYSRGYYYAFSSYGDKTTLHVPERCRSTYNSSQWGKHFKNIVEMD